MSESVIGNLSLVELEVQAVVGILPHERERLQPLFFCVDMEVDFSKALDSGSKLELDYSEVAMALKAKVIEKKYGLLEEMLLDCGASLMKAYPAILKLSLLVSKPQAVLDCKTVQASLTLNR